MALWEKRCFSILLFSSAINCHFFPKGDACQYIERKTCISGKSVSSHIQGYISAFLLGNGWRGFSLPPTVFYKEASMRKVKLIVHEKYVSKHSLSDIFAPEFDFYNFNEHIA